MKNMNTVRDFTIRDQFDRRGLLSEAREIVLSAEAFMGPEAPVKQADQGKPSFRHGYMSEKGADRGRGRIFDILTKLDAEQASFSPRLDVRRLTLKDFNEKGLQAAKEIKDSFRNYLFYQVGIPVTLFPRAGWAFTRLECWIKFCPDEPDVPKRPVVHDIFPEDVWQEILSFQNQLSVGLDEELRFRALVPELTGRWQQLSGEAKAKVSAVGGAKLTVGPFNYHLRRAGHGTGQVECGEFLAAGWQGVRRSRRCAPGRRAHGAQDQAGAGAGRR